MSACSWCEAAPWRLECAQCDPRRKMRVCAPCAARWHARGAAQEHEVVDALGVKRVYRNWARELAISDKAPSAGPMTDQQTQREHTGPESSDAATDDQPDVDMPGSPAAGEADSEVREDPETAIDLPLEQDDAPMTASSTDSSRASRRTLTKAETLDILVTRFPTEDLDAHAALTALTLRAVLMQDALLCVYFSRCTAPACARAFALHKRRKDGIPESLASSDAQEDEETQWAIAFIIHLDKCVSTTCPLCIRVRLRMNVGSIHALDRLLAIRRRELQHVADGMSATASNADQLGFAAESRRKMLTQQIEAMGDRRRQHMDMALKLERLNELQPLRGFSFPRFRWHLTKDSGPGGAPTMCITDPAIPDTGTTDTAAGNDGGDEPMLTVSRTEVATSTATSSAAGTNSNEATRMDTDAAAQSTGATQDTSSGGAATASRAPKSGAVGLEEASAPDESDHIDMLMAAKRAAPTSSSAAQALDEALELGCAIVDAGFCSPARASRCLLRCQSILKHLQHHVDLNVCSDDMCAAVEYHFAHLSQCRSSSTTDNVACEYCLRVRERELARAVEALEMEQPEADARVQSVINAMTDSLADDPPAEREQAIMQLEDELEQAEENKGALADKLSAERLALRRVRRRLDREGLFSTASAQRLPPHLIKVMGVTAS